jgi:hypothetical protein
MEGGHGTRRELREAESAPVFRFRKLPPRCIRKVSVLLSRNRRSLSRYADTCACPQADLGSRSYVEHPVNAVFVGESAEGVAPELLFKRHTDFASFRKLVEHVAQQDLFVARD